MLSERYIHFNREFGTSKDTNFMEMILFDNASLNMLYHVSNNSALPIVLAGSDTRAMEWIVWDDLCN